MAVNTAQRRYNRTVLLLSAAYAVILIAVIAMFRSHAPYGPLAYVAAILPALPIIGIFAAIGHYMVDEQDEYLRMLLVRQSLWASAFSLSIATAWGFLESFDLVGHVESYYVAILWFLGLAVGAIANRLTLGSGTATGA